MRTTTPTPKRRGSRATARVATPLPRVLQSVAFGAMCMLAAFGIGMQTAGDVHTFDTSEAATQVSPPSDIAILKGDVDGDGKMDATDAMAILSFADALEIPTTEQIRRADLDGDGRVTTKDVMRALHALSLR